MVAEGEKERWSHYPTLILPVPVSTEGNISSSQSVHRLCWKQLWLPAGQEKCALTFWMYGNGQFKLFMTRRSITTPGTYCCSKWYYRTTTGTSLKGGNPRYNDWSKLFSELHCYVRISAQSISIAEYDRHQTKELGAAAMEFPHFTISPHNAQVSNQLQNSK